MYLLLIYFSIKFHFMSFVFTFIIQDSEYARLLFKKLFQVLNGNFISKKFLNLLMYTDFCNVFSFNNGIFCFNFGIYMDYILGYKKRLNMMYFLTYRKTILTSKKLMIILVQKKTLVTMATSKK